VRDYKSLKKVDYLITKIKENAKGDPVEFILVGNKVNTYWMHA